MIMQFFCKVSKAEGELFSVSTFLSFPHLGDSHVKLLWGGGVHLGHILVEKDGGDIVQALSEVGSSVCSDISLGFRQGVTGER